MSSMSDERERVVDEALVADYLTHHPDFFSRHPGLLAEIELAHETGQAVSLIERQVAALREQVRRYRQQLRELLAIAEQNDRLAARFRELSLRFLDCRTGGEALVLLERSLREDFAADASTLLLRGAGPEEDWRLPSESVMTIVHGSDPWSALPTPLLNGESVCGRFGDDIMRRLFGERADGLASAALIPIDAGRDEPSALLAIGSDDPDRFTAGMGSVYLDYLGALLGRLLMEQGGAATARG